MYDFHQPIRFTLFLSQFADRKRESEATLSEIAVRNHGADVESVHYDTASLAAQIASRCPIIEDGSAALETWDVPFRTTPHIPPSVIATSHGRARPPPMAKDAIR